MKRQQMVGSTFYCPECGLKMTLPRKRARLPENNHIKHMYCFNCDKEQGFIEKLEINKWTTGLNFRLMMLCKEGNSPPDLE